MISSRIARRPVASFLLATVPWALSLSVLLSQPTVAVASGCPSYMEYHYSEQWTANSSNSYTLPNSNLYRDAYYGWVGIDGEIQAPDHVPNLGSDGSCAHSLGAIGVKLGDGSQLTTGWYTGCLLFSSPPTCRYVSLGAFVEGINLGTGERYVTDVGYIAPGSQIIFMIEFDSSSGCWFSYWQYNVLTGSLCQPVPRSGAMFAGSEVHTHIAGTVVEMPLTIYGNSNPNTNNGLRIKGANGFVPWTQYLSTGATSSYDERYATPGLRYWISAFNLCYKFESYGPT